MTDETTVSDNTEATEANVHRSQAVTANNTTWELLDGRSHNADEADDLLERAHAAAYHWRRATGGSAVNATRASWLLSRAYAVLGHGELALHHAEQCFRRLDEAGGDAADFDTAYAHEAKARALATLGRDDEARAERTHAAEVALSDPEDRKIFEADLAAGPWYGLADT